MKGVRKTTISACQKKYEHILEERPQKLPVWTEEQTNALVESAKRHCKSSSGRSDWKKVAQDMKKIKEVSLKAYQEKYHATIKKLQMAPISNLEISSVQNVQKNPIISCFPSHEISSTEIASTSPLESYSTNLPPVSPYPMPMQEAFFFQGYLDYFD